MTITFVLPPSLGHAKATARAELIQATLTRDLGEPVNAIVAETYVEIERCLLAGKAELVWAPAVVCARLGAVRAIFTIAREGRTTYRSALLARKEDRVTVTNLSGLRAAWVDPLSAGGYLLAATMLRGRGVDPDRVFSEQSFHGSHRAAVEAVLHGTADVAAVSAHEADAARLQAMLHWYAGPTGDRLEVIAVTEGCRNDAIVIPIGIPEGTAARLAEHIVPASPKARSRSRLLAALEAESLEPATIDDYRRLRALLWADPEKRNTLAPPPSARRSTAPPPPSARRSERPR